MNSDCLISCESLVCVYAWNSICTWWEKRNHRMLLTVYSCKNPKDNKKILAASVHEIPQSNSELFFSAAAQSYTTTSMSGIDSEKSQSTCLLSPQTPEESQSIPPKFTLQKWILERVFILVFHHSFGADLYLIQYFIFIVSQIKRPTCQK